MLLCKICSGDVRKGALHICIHVYMCTHFELVGKAALKRGPATAVGHDTIHRPKTYKRAVG